MDDEQGIERQLFRRELKDEAISSRSRVNGIRHEEKMARCPWSFVVRNTLISRSNSCRLVPTKENRLRERFGSRMHHWEGDRAIEGLYANFYACQQADWPCKHWLRCWSISRLSSLFFEEEENRSQWSSVTHRVLHIRRCNTKGPKSERSLTRRIQSVPVEGNRKSLFDRLDIDRYLNRSSGKIFDEINGTEMPLPRTGTKKQSSGSVLIDLEDIFSSRLFKQLIVDRLSAKVLTKGVHNTTNYWSRSSAHWFVFSVRNLKGSDCQREHWKM